MSTTNVWLRRNPKTDVQISEPAQFNTALINKNDFLKIVTIVGAARTGKSTLMNRLVESNKFKTSNSWRACTEGVCLSELKEVMGNGVVVYADTEGKGNNNINNDNKLLTPVVLLSKVVIFNVSRQVLVETLLDELEIFVHIGDRIRLDDRPLTFGHLIIAVRDYDFEDGSDEEVYNYYFQREESTNKDAVKRNEIRKKLLSMFQSIQVRLFRLPLNTVQNNPALEGLKNEIRNKVIEPRTIGESAYLTPGNVSRLTRAIVEQLRENNKLIVLSVVGLIQSREITAAHEQCRSSLSELFRPEEEVQPGSPWSGIEENLTNRKNGLIREFEEETKMADFESQYRNERKENLERFFRDELRKRKRWIKRDQEAKIGNEESAFETELNIEFDCIVLPEKDDRRIEERMRNVATRLFESFNRATNDLDLVTDRKQQLDQILNKYSEDMIASRKQENKQKIDCVKKAKEAFKKNLQDQFRSMPLLSRRNLNRELQKAKRNALRTFEQDTRDIDRSSEYKCQAKKKLELFSDVLEGEKLDENEQRLGQRQLVDNEKAKYEESLSSSFRKTILPVSQAGRLKEILEGKEDYCFRIFDAATRKIDLESEFVLSAKHYLKFFAMNEINEMIIKNLELIQDNNSRDRGGFGGALTGVGAAAAAAGGVLYVATDVTAAVVVGAVGAAAVVGVGVGGVVGYSIYKFST